MDSVKKELAEYSIIEMIIICRASEKVEAVWDFLFTEGKTKVKNKQDLWNLALSTFHHMMLWRQAVEQ